jgi:hypothetical protein
MALNLLVIDPWEKLAEDPFRGLRAGPANFSPSLLPMVTRKASGAHRPHHTPRTTEHGRGVLPRRKNES